MYTELVGFSQVAILAADANRAVRHQTGAGRCISSVAGNASLADTAHDPEHASTSEPVPGPS